MSSTLPNAIPASNPASERWPEASQLPHLAAYATFLKSHHIPAIVEAQIDLLKNNGVDIRSFLQLNADADIDARLAELVVASLDTISKGNIGDNIALLVRTLFSGSSTIIAGELKEKLAQMLASAKIRKQLYTIFLPDYTTDIHVAIRIIKEVDDFNSLFETAVTNKYHELLEKNIKRREELLLEAQKLAGIGSFIWNIDTMAAEVSAGMQYILDSDIVDGPDHFMKSVHEEDRPRLEAEMKRAIETNGIFDCTYRFTTPDAEKILRTRGIVSMIDGFRVMKGSVSDITQLQSLITRLEQSKANYKEAQQMGRIGNFKFDVRRKSFSWSDELYRIYDVEKTEQEISLAELAPLFDARDRQRVQDELAECIRSGEESTSIIRIITKKGVPKILEVMRAVLKDDTGKVTAVYGTVQDVSKEQGLIQNLKERTGIYRQMESLAQIGNWSLDIAKNEVIWSEGLYNIYDEPYIKGGRIDMTAMRKKVDEADLLETQKGIALCIAEGVPYSYKYNITLPDGSRKTLRGSGEAGRDKAGRIVRIFGTVQDITAHERLLTKLRDSEENLRQAQNIAHIGNGIFYVDNGDSNWSDELYNIFETNKSVRLDYGFISKLLPSKDWELMELHVRRCVEGGIRFDFHTRLLFDEGRQKNIRIIGEPVYKLGIVKEIFCTVQDVTELKTVERRLRENQRFSQKINDVSPAVIAILNLNTGEYKMVSRMATMLFGYTPEEVIKGGFEKMMSLIHPEDRQRILDENNAALRAANEEYPHYPDDKIIEFRYRLRHKDGNYRWVQTTAIVFDRDEDGIVQDILNVTIDISKLMAAEEKLRLNNQALQQSNSALQEFAYIASHDLQEPLRKISTFGTMLQGLNVEGLPDNGKMYLRKMIESASRMQGMVNDILSVSLISSVRSYEEVPLQNLLEDAITALEIKIAQTGAQVIITAPLPPAKVIESQMRQLFQNLIGNSLKFARPGVPPVINISHEMVRGAAAAGISETDDHHQLYLKIVLADNGIGFSNDYASRIFAIFQRLNGKSEYEGSGIGLAICRKIVEHHNGFISASGEVGKGATFTIVLPV